MDDDLHQLLTGLKLRRLQQILDDELRRAEENSPSYAEFLMRRSRSAPSEDVPASSVGGSTSHCSSKTRTTSPKDSIAATCSSSAKATTTSWKSRATAGSRRWACSRFASAKYPSRSRYRSA